MRSIDAFDPASGVRLSGILDVEPTKAGGRLRRLPAWTRSQLLDPAVTFMVTMPSGARIEMVTDSDVVEVDALLTRMQLRGEGVRPAVFELTLDGEVVAAEGFDEGSLIVIDPVTQEVEMRRGSPTTIRFEGLPAGAKRVEIWLAQGASFELRDLRVTSGASVLPAPPDRRPRWIHYGSSISHCMEADGPTGVWPVVAARRAGLNLTNLGFAGQCHLDQFVARTIRDLPAELITLKAGINVVNGDTMRERIFLSALQGFLDTVRDGHPETPIGLITPIICPVAEDHPGPTLRSPGGATYVVDRPTELSLGALTLGRIRQLASDVVEARKSAGDKNLHLIDGLSLFGPDDVGDLPDGLHPNAEGYRRMGKRFCDLALRGEGPLAQAVAV